MGKHSHPPSGIPPQRRIDLQTRRVASSKADDSYRATAKGEKAFVCTQCGVCEHAGKWSWGGPPLTDIEHGICPACRRTQDNYPAGRIELRGLQEKEREEVLNLVRNLEQTEKAEHPLERIMAIGEEEDLLLVTTTGVHLGRAIAGALGRRFRGQVQVDYPEGEQRIRVRLDR